MGLLATILCILVLGSLFIVWGTFAPTQDVRTVARLITVLQSIFFATVPVLVILSNRNIVEWARRRARNLITQSLVGKKYVPSVL